MESQSFYYESESAPYGRTYGHWTVRWWRWFLSTPRSSNPVMDETGRYADMNQPGRDVFFLVGKLVDESSNFPSRICRIPSDRSVLFPVINCEANRLERPELKTEEDIIRQVEKDEDTIVKKDCILDGKRIPAQRVRSDPLIFELNVVNDNVFDIQGGQTISASADGYWIFLKPMPPGKHIVYFEGSCEYGRLNSGARYQLEVIDHKQI